MKTNFDELTRRQFMVNSAYKYLGVSLAPMLGSLVGEETVFAASEPARRTKTAKSVIFLNMSGGMSHVDTFDPKPDGGEDINGGIETINTNADGVRLSQYLPKLAGQADKMCVINSMKSNQGAHEQGQYLIHRSYAPRGTIRHPSMGSWVVRLAGRRNPTIPPYVTISPTGGGTGDAGFMGTSFAAVPVQEPANGLQDSKLPYGVEEDEFKTRLKLAETMNKKFHHQFEQPQVADYQKLYYEAVKLMRSEDLKAFDLNEEAGSVVEEYGADRFGQGCLLARRLVEHNVRFVEVGLGGWDTHYDNFNSVEDKASILDQGMSALLADLNRRGMLDETIVVLGTEFGRTPDIVRNHNNGRDHYPRAYSCVIAGGGIRGGQTYGKTDKKGKGIDENPVEPKQINATIAYALGLPLEQIIYSASKRPFVVADHGQPLFDIFG